MTPRPPKPSPEDSTLRPVALKGKPLRRLAILDGEADEPPHRPVHDPERETAEIRRPAKASIEEKRRLLAELLWGNSERAETVSPPEKCASETPKETADGSAVSDGDDLKRRSSLRRECNFPGLLRILVPEQTFQPKVYAIRMLDISPHGARVMTRQLSPEMAGQIQRERRYARLEVMVPSHEKLILPGRVAWLKTGEEGWQLGVEFDHHYPQVDSLFTQALESSSTALDPCKVPSPRIHPFPAVTGQASFTFTGTANGSEMILVRNGLDERRVPTSEDRFEVEVTLAPDRSNFLSFTGLRGGLRSLPTPVCLVHRTGADDTPLPTSPAVHRHLVADEAEGVLRLQLSGGGTELRALLEELDKALEHADRATISLDLQGNARLAQEALRNMKTEA